MLSTQVQTQVETKDTSLLFDVLRGEERAIEQLFDRHSVAVYSVAKRILRDGPSAEDVMHDIFMLIWREPNTFLQADGDLRDRLMILSRDRSIVLLRDRARAGLQVAAQLFDRYEKDERKSATARALLAIPLSDEHFRIVDMTFFKGLTISQIAADTGRSAQAVKKDLCLELQKLSLTRQAATKQPI